MDDLSEPLKASDQSTSPDLTWLNRRLREMLMQAPSAIGITSGPEHRWAYVNTARIKMAGRTRLDDFVGKTVRESYPELEGQPFFPALDQAYQSGVAFVGNELKASFKRGPGGEHDEAFLDCVYQPIFASDGTVEGLLIHTVEVTEKVVARRELEVAHAREQLQRAEAEFERNQLRELFEQAPTPIAIFTGSDHRWTFANESYGEIVGRPASALLNRPIRDALPELQGQGFFELLDEVFRTGTPYVGKGVRAVLNRGAKQVPQEAYFDFIYHPVQGVNGGITGLMVFAVEVTDQFKTNSELESKVSERTLELQRAHSRLRDLSGRLLTAQDEERRRVARDLHDSAGQYLAALQMNLSVLASDADRVPEGFRTRVDDCIELVTACTSEIRTLSYLLHPPLLDEMGLESAIEWYVKGFSERSGMEVAVDVAPKLGRFSKDLETAVFRIVQQGLANAHRHSGSKRAGIKLNVSGTNLLLEISDEGLGISSDVLAELKKTGHVSGVGIAGMRERVNGLLGTFDVQSGPRGTTLAVSLPVTY